MNTKGDPRATRTPAAVIFVACVTGALGAFFFGGIGALGAAFGGVGEFLGLITVINCALTGAASGVSLVGLCALIARSELNRHFSYPFTVSLGGVLGLFSFIFLESWIGGNQGKWSLIQGSWFAAIILCAVGGTVLAWHIRGYGAPSRASAAVAAISMLPIGGFFNFWLLEGLRDDEWLLLVLTLLFSVFGGVLGAVGGAIRAT